MKVKHATWRPVSYTGLHKRQPHKAALLHTNGGGSDHGSLYGWWEAGAKGQRGPDNLHIGAQIQVMADGRAEQYVNSDLVVYHAYGASEWAVGIETQDDGHPEHPWTPAQVATIVAILHDLGVPGKMLRTASPADGVGYHQQFTAWNQSGHACPGDVRHRQLVDEVIPALRHAYRHGLPKGPHPLSTGTRHDVDQAAARLERRKGPVKAGGGERHALRRLRDAIRRVLHRTAKP